MRAPEFDAVFRRRRTKAQLRGPCSGRNSPFPTSLCDLLKDRATIGRRAIEYSLRNLSRGHLVFEFLASQLGADDLLPATALCFGRGSSVVSALLLPNHSAAFRMAWICRSRCSLRPRIALRGGGLMISTSGRKASVKSSKTGSPSFAPSAKIGRAHV